jgi:hypothetical protein
MTALRGTGLDRLRSVILIFVALCWVMHTVMPSYEYLLSSDEFILGNAGGARE